MNAPSFTAKYLSDIPFDEEARKHLAILDQNFSSDFSTSGRGYFTQEDQEKIQEQACLRLKEKLKGLAEPIGGNTLRQSWSEIVIDFHRNNFWNFHPQQHKPVKVLSEEQKTYREMWPYVWVLIQSGILLKTLVYYFGINASNDPSTENTVFLCLALATSAGTLIFFAWRKTRK